MVRCLDIVTELEAGDDEEEEYSENEGGDGLSNPAKRRRVTAVSSTERAREEFRMAAKLYEARKNVTLARDALLEQVTFMADVQVATPAAFSHPTLMSHCNRSLRRIFYDEAAQAQDRQFLLCVMPVQRGYIPRHVC